MTTSHHTPLAFGGPLTSAAMEAPLGQLDAAINAVVVTGSGTSTSLTAQANAGQASLTVANSAGFVAGDPIYIGTGATFESRIIATVPNATTITVTANLTNTYAIGRPVSKSPVEIVDARAGSTTLKDRLAILGGSLYNVKTYGALGDGSGNDAGAIQTALDAVVASGKPGVVLLPQGTYRITAGITVNPSYASLIGYGAVIDASPIVTGAAITVGGTLNPPYNQATQSLEGFRLTGPGQAVTAAIGILFDKTTGTGEGPSHIHATNLVVHAFGRGLQFKSRAHNMLFTGCDVYNCNRCIDLPAGVTDGGESLVFVRCTIFNSDVGVMAANTVGEVQFVGSSFDYNTKQFDINDSRVDCIACHIEGSKTVYTATPILVAGNGGTFRMFGGWLLEIGAAGPSANPYVVDCSASGGMALFNGVYINNMQTSTGEFATGTGAVLVRDCSSTSTADNPRILSAHANNNRLVDGGFEQTTLRDDVFISADTAAITSRVTGANIALTTDVAEFRSGARSLKAQKTGGGGSSAHWAVAVPVDSGSHPAVRLWYRKPGAQTGSMDILTSWALMRVNGDGVPLITNRSDIGVLNVPFTAAAVPWTKFESGEPTLRRPAWATHFIVLVSMDAFVGPGAVYFDDIIITEM